VVRAPVPGRSDGSAGPRLAVDRRRRRFDEAIAEERRAETWETRALVALARPEREDVQLGQRVQRVRAASREVDDAVALADLGNLATVPREAMAGEHVEDLLRASVLVCRRRPGAGAYLDPSQADPDTTGALAEVRPGRLQMADPQLAALGFVEVGKSHACLL